MCGIVGVVAERNAVPILMEGLRRLEYRGYDSAGLAVIGADRKLERMRTVGKVKVLQEALEAAPIAGHVGIAHTRWATHGVPTTRNAHPHVSRDGIADRAQRHHRESRGAARRPDGPGLSVRFGNRHRGDRAPHPPSSREQRTTCSRRCARRSPSSRAPTRSRWCAESDPEGIVLARAGCPVVIGLGIDENFVASDVAALLPVTRRFMFLEEGDVAEIRRKSDPHRRFATAGAVARAGARERTCPPTRSSAASTGTSCSRRFTSSRARSRRRSRSAWPARKLLDAAFGPAAQRGRSRRSRPCTSPRAARAFTPVSSPATSSSSICRIPARVEIASEYRYRNPVITPDTLFVTISQSGETADTLAALRNAQGRPATSRR